MPIFLLVDQYKQFSGIMISTENALTVGHEASSIVKEEQGYAAWIAFGLEITQYCAFPVILFNQNCITLRDIQVIDIHLPTNVNMLPKQPNDIALLTVSHKKNSS